jgi:hypothetical protein
MWLFCIALFCIAPWQQVFSHFYGFSLRRGLHCFFYMETSLMKSVKRFITVLLIASTTMMGLPLSAHAAIVPSEVTLSADRAHFNRAYVNTFLARADVRSAMQERGVDSADALARVQAMSDAEVAQLAGRIDQAPAGGDVLGLVFTVFIILLVTDILGLTKVFPFTRSVR